MKQNWLIPAAMFAALVAGPFAIIAQDDAPKTEIKPDDDPLKKDPVALTNKLIESLSPSIVQAEYFFKQDDSGAPTEYYVQKLCPNCKSYHTESVDSLIRKRVPMSTTAYAVKDGKFLSEDVGIIPRYLERIELTTPDGKRVAAKITACFPARNAVELTPEKPLDGVKPLVFQKEDAKNASKFRFYVVKDHGMLIAGVAPESTEIQSILDAGMTFRKGLPSTILLNKDLAPLSLSFKERHDLNETLVAPDAWTRQSAEDREKARTVFEEKLQKGFYTVRVRLAAPPTEQLKRRRFEYGSDDPKKNEFKAPGLLLENGLILVNQLLSSDQTARLTNVEILLPDGKTMNAQFVGTLKNWGAFVVKPEKDLPKTTVPFYKHPTAKLFGQKGYRIPLKIFNDKLQLMPIPQNFTEFSVGYDNQTLPEGRYESLYLTGDGEIVLWNMERRINRERYGNANTSLSGSYIAALLDGTYDPENIPRSEEDRLRIAWLGAELQGLSEELAESLNVSEFTENGENGALVGRVFPGSPAEKAGLKEGMILVGFRPETETLRTAIRGSDVGDDMFQGDFPWDRYDEIPEQYYDHIPTPWPPVNNNIAKKLTEIGIGKNVILSVVENGKFGEKKMQIGQSPAYYENAKRSTDKNLGITTANLTFEVRNYFRIEEKSPGIVITAVKAGTPASVAGLKPYEIILNVNDKPVNSVEEFDALIKGKTEFELTVRRLSTNRVVKFNLKPAKAE